MCLSFINRKVPWTADLITVILSVGCSLHVVHFLSDQMNTISVDRLISCIIRLSLSVILLLSKKLIIYFSCELCFRGRSVSQLFCHFFADYVLHLYFSFQPTLFQLVFRIGLLDIVCDCSLLFSIVSLFATHLQLLDGILLCTLTSLFWRVTV